MRSNFVATALCCSLLVLVIIAATSATASRIVDDLNDQENIINERVEEDPEQMPGGFSGERKPTDEVRGLIHQVEKDIYHELATSSSTTNSAGRFADGFDSIEVVSYKTQVVAGLNYRVTCRGVKAGERDVLLRVRIFQSLPGSDGEVSYKVTSVEVVDAELNL